MTTRSKPAIGILTASLNHGVGGNTQNFARIIRAASRQDVLCHVFNISAQGDVMAYAYDKHNRTFSSCTCSLPRVLYNRIPTRRLESLPAIKSMMDQWAGDGYLVTNPRFLRKDDFISKWFHDPVLSAYTPKTEVLDSFEAFASFLNEHYSVYIKPIDGKAGVGIYKITRVGHRVRVVKQRAKVIQQLGDMPLREAFVLVQKGRPLPSFVIQEEAQTATYQGRKFDLRLLIHRLRNDRFDVTGMGARVAGQHGVTTHVPNGGFLASANDALESIYGKDHGAKVKAKVTQVALKAADQIATIPGLWSELSMDIGISPAGEPVLFEANAKPMKFDERDIEMTAKVRLVTLLQSWASK